MIEKNTLYWADNLPLQVWPLYEGSDDKFLSVVDARILNYMPLKERCEKLYLSELLGEQTREEFFETAALVLESLANKMRAAAKDPTLHVYYPIE